MRERHPDQLHLATVDPLGLEGATGMRGAFAYLVDTGFFDAAIGYERAARELEGAVPKDTGLCREADTGLCRRTRGEGLGLSL
jgi:hypothetical protein